MERNLNLREKNSKIFVYLARFSSVFFLEIFVFFLEILDDSVPFATGSCQEFKPDVLFEWKAPWAFPPSVPIGTLRSDDSDGNGNATKAIGLISKTTILHVHHAFLYISLPSLHDYNVKMPNFTVYRGRTQATTKFLLSF